VLADQYKAVGEKENVEIENAYVTFRSAEGAARFRDAYSMNWISRTLAPYFGCCTDEN
jgi:hypothetical protein